jgi:hypothetical protein
MNTLTHTLLTIALLVILLLLSDVLPFWMPDMMGMIVLVVLAVLMLVWIGFVLRENGGDERDMEHRMYAGRAAYLSGIAVLTLALLIQGFAHAVDPWIPAALDVMLLAKLFSRFYLDKHH